MGKFRLLFFLISLLVSVGAGIMPAQAELTPQIAAGLYHTIALKADGTLWAWGNNRSGQLGIGTTTTQAAPIKIPGNTTWVAVAAGANHTIALDEDGNLWAWGNNGSGQLGDGSTTNSLIPVKIGTDTWTSIAAGASHSIALDTNERLWVWGWNGYGQLGTNTVALQSFPLQIGTDTTWTSIAAGAYHSIALDADGNLWAWGNNGSGQLGDGTTTNKLTPTQEKNGNTDWTSVTAGGSHTIALKTDGTLWAWGKNGSGQLGDDSTTNSLIPVQIGTDTTWATIAAGGSHTIALKTDGTLWTWGMNFPYGQLGDGTLTNRTSPFQIMTPKQLTVNKAGAGSGTVTGGGTYDYGTTQQITAIADTGSTFTGWSGDCAGTESQLELLINRDKTCTATFYKFPWPMFLPAITKGIR